VFDFGFLLAKFWKKIKEIYIGNLPYVFMFLTCSKKCEGCHLLHKNQKKIFPTPTQVPRWKKRTILSPIQNQ
jgi:hypothetical protein